jgi:hypothetical protein
MNRTQLNRAAVVAIALFAATGLASSSEADRIEASLKTIEKSKVVFIRNGDEHDSKAAADHLRSKVKRAGAGLTFDGFVDGLATKSSLSGKPYQVRLPDGTVVPLAKWLREKDKAAAAPAAAPAK